MSQECTGVPELSQRSPEASGETLCSGRAESSRGEEGRAAVAHATGGSPDPLIGAVVGSFRLVRKLGGGGMGTVYLGEHTLIGSKVAVKFLHDHFASNKSLVQRFLAEARAVNLIGHENIINIFDMNLLPPRRHYLVMEYLEGSSLSSLLSHAVAPAVVVPILTQVCDALQAAHARGVVHRDLKPENIFLIRHDRTPHFVKVLDFGIAKLLDQDTASTQTAAGMLIGTPEYMAPEQWAGKDVDGRTDLYALGIIAYMLLTGRRPFSDASLGGMLQAHLKQVPMSPHGVNPAVPVVLSDVVMRALAKRPEDRFQSASELRAALERAIAPAALAPVARPVPLATPVASATPHAVHVAPVTPHAMAAVPMTPHAMPVARATPPAAPVERATPPAVPAAQPSGAHALVDVIARVVIPPASEPRHLPCTDLTRAGLFLCTDGALPPLRSRLALTLELRDRNIPCVAEVVRHVPAAQASSWGMRAGFAVQFLELSAEARVALARLTPGQTPLPVSTPRPLPDDPQAESLLGALLRRMSSDPYALLELAPDASFDDVRQHLRATQRTLDAIAARPLSIRQSGVLGELRARVERAAETLGQPHSRLEHDAWRGNFAGVARCISSGLTDAELESLRARHLLAHPGAEVRGRMHANVAASREARGELVPALTEYEKALALDPLNLTVQQRYCSLKRRVPRKDAHAPAARPRLQPPSGDFMPYGESPRP
jgi:tRNA A-37 threonylcarbamoyl transferase component Bud32